MQGPKIYLENCRDLQSSKRGHASYRKIAARTGYTGNSTKCSIIGGDLNLPYADWNGNTCGNSGTQALTNSLV